MNERIRELAEQATVTISYRVCQHTFKEIDDLNGPFVRKEFSKEKFAELIVRECEKSIKSVPTHFEAQDKIIVECLKAIRETFRS